MSGIRVCPKCHGHNSECYHCGGGGADTPDRPLNVIRPARKKSATDQDLERKRRRAMNDPKALAEGQARLAPARARKAVRRTRRTTATEARQSPHLAMVETGSLLDWGVRVKLVALMAICGIIFPNQPASCPNVFDFHLLRQAFFSPTWRFWPIRSSQPKVIGTN